MKIIRNSIKTPDGTVLTSYDRWDYKTHVDANGEIYMVDGGKDYLRRSVNIEPYEELSVYSDSPFEEIREAFAWGSYGKNGDEPLKIKALKDLSDEHIHAIITTQFHISKEVKDLFKQEQEYRNVQGNNSN